MPWCRPVLLASLSALACAASDAPSEASALVLAECRVQGLAARCGVLEVPRGAEGGETVPLRVVVVPAHSRTPAADPVFMLAGGPGQAASEAFPALLHRLEPVLEHRDVVLIDQRGTGASAALDCDPGPEDLATVLQPTPDVSRLRDCADRLQVDPADYLSHVAADDLDRVRRALGAERVDLIGGSYGTRLALVYARRHPGSVRALVLDGVAPPDMALPLSFATDAQAALDAAWRDCDGEPACRAAFAGIHADFERLLAELGPGRRVSVRHPRTGSDETLELSAETVSMLVRGVLYAPELVAMLPLAVRSAGRGDWSPLLASALAFADDARESMSLGLMLSILCTEDLPRIDDAAVARETAGTFLGPAAVDVFRRMCAMWPRAIAAGDHADPVVSDAPTLLLSGALDPVTPPRWAEHAAETLSRARHVVVPGAGHGTLTHGCVPDLIAGFLDTADPATVDAECVVDGRRPPFFVDFAGPPS